MEDNPRWFKNRIEKDLSNTAKKISLWVLGIFPPTKTICIFYIYDLMRKKDFFELLYSESPMMLTRKYKRMKEAYEYVI